jgi:hypothetical protein
MTMALVGGRRRTFAALLLGLATACTTSTTHTVAAPEFAPLRAAGLRVAVLPFTVSAPEDGFLSAALAPVAQVLALEAGGPDLMRARLGDRLRGDLVKWLQRGDLRLVDPWHSDTALGHAGWSPQAMQDRTRAAEAARLLQVDAILYGDVTRWNRDWYVVQSTVAVAVAIELRHQDGRVLFTADRLERIGSGVTGGPTGYVSALTEPIAGLKASHLEGLTRAVARGLAMDLGADGSDGDARRHALAPHLSVVAPAFPHAGALRAGDRLEVTAIGTPDCEVRFDLGRLLVGVPMAQVAVDASGRSARATYRGYYVVPAAGRALDLPLSCTIRPHTGVGNGERLVWLGTVPWAPQAP